MFQCRWVAKDKRKFFYILMCTVILEIALVIYIVSAEHARFGPLRRELSQTDDEDSDLIGLGAVNRVVEHDTVIVDARHMET